MVKVKICGITNEEDAINAVNFGASALGFVFHKKSPRYISPYKAQKIIAQLPPFVSAVGVFVNLKEGAVMDIADLAGLRTLQFHGDEDATYCRRFKKYQVIKAFRIGERFRGSDADGFNSAAFLFDAYQEDQFGGTGKVFNWELIQGKKFNRPIILSGGLTPDNVAEAIRSVRPYAVDVSSGVEKTPGKKDYLKMQAFFAAVQSVA